MKKAEKQGVGKWVNRRVSTYLRKKVRAGAVNIINDEIKETFNIC